MNDPDTARSPDLHTTDDGSHTLYSHKFQQHYHNPGGSVTESGHVFLEKSGLAVQFPHVDELTILEIGFGTGLNFLLLLDEYLDSNSNAAVTFYSVERFPIRAGLAKSLNYREFIRHPDIAEELYTVFSSCRPGFNRYNPLENITLILFIGPFDEFGTSGIQADYIFHDPFSPDVNPGLWSGKTFEKLKQAGTDKTILTTYCAASAARGAMAWAGWHVARDKGALGKREMTVASPSANALGHLKRVNEERLAERYEHDDF